MTTLWRLLALSAVALALALAAPLGAAATEPGDDEPCAVAAERGAGTPDDDCEDADEADGEDADPVEEACAGDDEELEDEAAGDDAAVATAGDDDELVDEDGVDGAPLFRDFCEAPVFDAAFLARTWEVEAGVEDWDGGELLVTVERLRHVPRAWREQAEQLEDVEALVAVGRRTPVTHRRRGRVPRRALGRAREVLLRVRLVAPADWSEDEDGLLVPTARARSVRIVR